MDSYYLISIPLTGLLFLCMILLLAYKPRFAAKVTSTLIVIIAVSGIFFYGYGFSYTAPTPAIALVRALLAVCGMFTGKQDIGSIAAAPLMQEPGVLFLFWLVHLGALYAMTSAVITTVGARALRMLRVWLARRGDLVLIRGLTAESLALGRALAAKPHTSVVFVDGAPPSGLADGVHAAHCVLRSDGSALACDRQFFKGMGAGRPGRRIALYAIGDDPAVNMTYASALLAQLKQGEVAPEQTSLVLMTREREGAVSLQNLDRQYGYGYVSLVEPAQLAARLLMQQYPMCDRMEFDETGRAKQDMEVLQVGFGRVGQAVLRQTVMNGQFAGSRFRATVFDPDWEKVDGSFFRTSGPVTELYDVTFRACDGRSRELFRHLEQRAAAIRYVVVCTGSDERNLEIGREISACLREAGSTVPVCICSHRGVRAYDGEGALSRLQQIWQPGLLSADGLDRVAMELNQQYQSNGRTAVENWMCCDWFSRMSCRASADYLPALLRMAGKTPEQALEHWAPAGELLENLAHSEHLRWNAFHHCMGFRAMTREEFAARAETARQQQAAGQTPLRVAKNMAGRTHACLVDWDGLEELSARELALTGRKVDYKQMDRDNVLAVPMLLKQKGGL